MSAKDLARDTGLTIEQAQWLLDDCRNRATAECIDEWLAEFDVAALERQWNPKGNNDDRL